jgi:hypothetical protein
MLLILFVILLVGASGGLIAYNAFTIPYTPKMSNAELTATVLAQSNHDATSTVQATVTATPTPTPTPTPTATPTPTPTATPLVTQQAAPYFAPNPGPCDTGKAVWSFYSGEPSSVGSYQCPSHGIRITYRTDISSSATPILYYFGLNSVIPTNFTTSIVVTGWSTTNMCVDMEIQEKNSDGFSMSVCLGATNYTWEIGQFIVSTPLQSGSLSAQASFKISMKAHGSALLFYINDQLVYTDNTALVNRVDNVAFSLNGDSVIFQDFSLV